MPVQQPRARPSLLLATRNRGKVREVREILGAADLDLVCLADLPAMDGHDVEETGLTFLENALLKARAAALVSGLPALADDSGLVVDALKGAPGVHSARYAGVRGDDGANNRRLIAALAEVPPERRTARFVCSLVLFVPGAQALTALGRLASGARSGALEDAPEGTPVAFPEGVAVAWSGVIEGRVLDEPRGAGGFGYDPHFYLPERGCTTAELPSDEKNALSHRGQAVRKFAQALALC